MTFMIAAFVIKTSSHVYLPAKYLSQQVMELFRLYILFSQYRSCENTQEVWSFVLFIKKSDVHASMNMSACTL